MPIAVIYQIYTILTYDFGLYLLLFLAEYGLAASVFTKDIDMANKISSSLRAGTVWVNCYDNFDVTAPFGGYKQSGYGREKGEYGLHNYLEVKCVTVKTPPKTC